MKFRSSKNNQPQNGFTLIELMVSLAIFAFMTAFLLAKYGTFNQSTLLTNLAYDTAITIRGAQSYGLNVQGVTVSSATTCNNVSVSAGNPCFFYPYGVDFNTVSPNQFIFFTDLSVSGQFNSANNAAAETISTYNMNRGYSIYSICAGAGASSTCFPATQLDITFKRPIPDAIINANIVGGGWQSGFAYAKITLTANNATTSVVVQSTGEISVGNY